MRLKDGKLLNSQINDTGAAEHFTGDGHNFDRDLELYLLESGRWKSAVERRKRESYYICKFSTLEPAGLNKAAGIMGNGRNRSPLRRRAPGMALIVALGDAIAAIVAEVSTIYCPNMRETRK